MRRAAVWTLAALFAAPLARAESVSDLAAAVSAFLTGSSVRHAPTVVAVTSVRGSAPVDEQEDLDQLLLDSISEQRAALGAGADVASLRREYAALSVSYWTQAYAASEDAELRAKAGDALAVWARAEHDPPAPDNLTDVLRKTPDAFDEKMLVAAGWGRYCHSILPAPVSAPAAGGPPLVDARTAKLDELLDGLRQSWTQRQLSDAARARALLLAGNVASALSAAPLRPVRAATEAAAAVSAAPVADAQAAAAQPPFSARRIYDSAAPSVVVVIGSDPQGSGELGSGSVIDAKGAVLTNAHVVIQDSTGKPWPKLTVYLKPSRMTGDPKEDLVDPVPARVLRFDRALDLAVLDVGDAQGRLPPPLSFDPPGAVSIGDPVAAIGHPEQGGFWTLTTGVISSLVADVGGVRGKHVFQTDASINRGNSGGPLLDARGRIVGVNTLMSRKAADGLAITSVNFAIRSDVAQAWLRGGRPAAVASDEGASGARPAAKPAAATAAARPVPKPVTITESRPYSEEEILAREIKEMDDLGKEMHEEVLRHAPQP